MFSQPLLVPSTLLCMLLYYFLILSRRNAMRPYGIPPKDGVPGFLRERGQIKTPFILTRTKSAKHRIFGLLVVPPSFAIASRQRPQRVSVFRDPTPDYGGIRLRSTFTTGVISAGSYRVFFTACDIRTCTTRPLSACPTDRYSSHQRFYAMKL